MCVDYACDFPHVEIQNVRLMCSIGESYAVDSMRTYTHDSSQNGTFTTLPLLAIQVDSPVVCRVGIIFSHLRIMLIACLSYDPSLTLTQPDSWGVFSDERNLRVVGPSQPAHSRLHCAPTVLGTPYGHVGFHHVTLPS